MEYHDFQISSAHVWWFLEDSLATKIKICKHSEFVARRNGTPSYYVSVKFYRYLSQGLHVFELFISCEPP